MKSFVIFSLLLVAINADPNLKWTELRARFSPTPNPGVDSFYKIETTLKEALAAGWVVATTDNAFGAQVVCYSKKDNRICPIYDKTGYIAGVLTAIPPSDVDGQGIPYDFSKLDVYEKKSINGVVYWTSTFYIINPADIPNGVRPQAPAIGDSLYFKKGSTYKKIPTKRTDIAKTEYKWQNCIPGMGIHYYNNMTKDLKCEEFQPFFLLVQNDYIVGIGWQFYGKTKIVDRNWYEDIDRQGVQATVPIGPTCLYDGVDKYGIISTHFYFVDKPWTIPCKQSTDSVVPIPGLP